MTLPGKQTSISSEGPTRLNALDTAAWHVAGITAQGPLGPVAVRSIAEFVRIFGARVSWASRLYDSLDAFFAGGGGIAYVSRIVGADAATATGVLDDDAAADALIVDAVGPGDWANGIEVAADRASGSDSFSLTVTVDDELVEESPVFETIEEAVSWSNGSAYIRLTDGGNDVPAESATTTLAGGDDDRDNIDDETTEAALDRFTEDHGPGQLSVPGDTSAATHAALLAKGESRNRVPLLDLIDSGSESTLTSAVEGLRDDVGARFAGVFAPWVPIAGTVPGTTRTVPSSAIVAAQIAALEAQGESPNVAAAGANGIIAQAQGLSQDPWTDDEREALNDGGVNVIRQVGVGGQIRIYGFRTLVDPQVDDLWLQLSGSRMVMRIRAEWEEIAERYVFSEIDGRGFRIGDFREELKGVCARYYPLSLFGETPDDAFFIDTGDSVNTPESIAAGFLKARGEVRVSPFAERVEINIVRRRLA